MINNLSDIVRHDPGFATQYLEEKEQLVNVLTDGHPELLSRANEVIAESRRLLAESAE